MIGCIDSHAFVMSVARALLNALEKDGSEEDGDQDDDRLTAA